MYSNDEGIHFIISREVFITKYVKEGSYSFIYSMYDNTLQIESNSSKNKEYRAMIEQCSRNDVHIALKSGYVSENRVLNIGDKNTLYYTHTITLKVPDKSFTKDTAIKIAKLVKLK